MNSLARNTMAQPKTTIDHDVNRKWAEQRNGHLARAKGTAAMDNEGGIPRIEFGEPEESLEDISWKEFIRVFEDRELAFPYLAFLHQDDKARGGKRCFRKLVHRSAAHASSEISQWPP